MVSTCSKVALRSSANACHDHKCANSYTAPATLPQIRTKSAETSALYRCFFRARSERKAVLIKVGYRLQTSSTGGPWVIIIYCIEVFLGCTSVRLPAGPHCEASFLLGAGHSTISWQACNCIRQSSACCLSHSFQSALKTPYAGTANASPVSNHVARQCRQMGGQGRR